MQDLDKCFEFAKAREKITKRVVPKEVIENSFKDSISTTLQIKEIFSNSVILNLIDRVDNKLYEDISANEFYPRSHAERGNEGKNLSLSLHYFYSRSIGCMLAFYFSKSVLFNLAVNKPPANPIIAKNKFTIIFSSNFSLT